jgi:hypothetical protein
MLSDDISHRADARPERIPYTARNGAIQEVDRSELVGPQQRPIEVDQRRSSRLSNAVSV